MQESGSLTSKKLSSLPPTEDNNPPFSRIYITCGKYITEDELHDAFSQFGEIESCRLLTDKHSGSFKGSAFLKFRKTSSAAKAIEEMDSKTINNHKVKVEIAVPKGARNKKVYTNEPEDTPPRSRLFVVCPKEMKESTLRKRFQKSKGFEYAKVISDKDTGESKGFAFIKFNSAYCAALAMESVFETGEIDGVKVKVLIADPKLKTQGTMNVRTPSTDYEFSHYMEGTNTMYPMPYPGYYAYPMYAPEQYYPNVLPMPRIVVTCDPSITTSQLRELFSGYYGVEHCEMEVGLSSDSAEPQGIGHVTFNSLQAADNAMLSIHGTEYPAGSRIECAWDPVQSVPTPIYNPANMFVQPYPPMYALSTSPPMGYPQMGTQTEVAYSMTKPMDQKELNKLFSEYGTFVFSHQEKENGKGVVSFSNPNAAWCAVRDLDQFETQDRNLLSLHLL